MRSICFIDHEEAIKKIVDAMREQVAGLLTEIGYLAVEPVTQPYFETFTNEKGY